MNRRRKAGLVVLVLLIAIGMVAAPQFIPVDDGPDDGDLAPPGAKPGDTNDRR